MAAKKILKYVVLLVVAGNLAIIAAVLLGGRTPPPPRPMPNPNGYDDFVKAGSMIVYAAPYFTNNDLNEAVLPALIATNAEALKFVRTGLGRECRVPVEYSTKFLNANMPLLAEFKQLALV